MVRNNRRLEKRRSIINSLELLLSPQMEHQPAEGTIAANDADHGTNPLASVADAITVALKDAVNDVRTAQQNECTLCTYAVPRIKH